MPLPSLAGAPNPNARGKAGAQLSHLHETVGVTTASNRRLITVKDLPHMTTLCFVSGLPFCASFAKAGDMLPDSGKTNYKHLRGQTVAGRLRQNLWKSGGCPLWPDGQQGFRPRCMPSTTGVQKCRGLPPAFFEQTGAKGSAPGGSQGAVEPWWQGMMMTCVSKAVPVKTTKSVFLGLLHGPQGLAEAGHATQKGLMPRDAQDSRTTPSVYTSKRTPEPS